MNHELKPNSGILLINLGTPDSADVADVRRYLGEFLMDPFVLSAPTIIRALIVYGFILPFRPNKSAEAYASIWTDEGSPLLTGSQRLADELAAELQAPVVLSMRYGNPSIQAGIEELAAQGVEHVIVVPLYAQHADSTVTTSLRAVEAALPATMQHSVLPPFYGADEHSQAWGELIKQHLPEQWDHLLLSYHGLPEQHLRKADPTKNHCLQQEDCCYHQSPAHKTCYRHQVYATSSNIAAHIGLSEDQYSVSFQSRLGPLPWLSPYTDKVLAELPDQGVKNLVVASPAFVVDNLETLEEIGMQGQETFLEAGGESFHLVPCLNADPLWVSGLARLCRGAA